jgi:hypothetical protein
MRKIAINLETQKRNASRSLPVIVCEPMQTSFSTLILRSESNVCEPEQKFDFRDVCLLSMWHVTFRAKNERGK